jgi:hypothetical protein
VPVSVYPARQSADGIVQQVRTGKLKAYCPAGFYDAYAAIHPDGAAVWVRYMVGAVELEPLPDNLTVRVPDYGPEGRDELVEIRTVVISATCPRCGGLRGKVNSTRFVRDGATHSCDTWHNACGHQDAYVTVLAEAQEREALLKRLLPRVYRMRGVPGGLFATAVDLIGDLVADDRMVRAHAAADVLEQAGHVWEAEVIRAYANGSTVRGGMLARSVAVYLNDRDTDRTGIQDTRGGAL